MTRIGRIVLVALGGAAALGVTALVGFGVGVGLAILES
jgi:hypothetical protein